MNKKIKIKKIALFVITIFSISFALSASYIDSDSSDFFLGIQNLTFYNSSGFLQLNSTIMNGSFTSQIFNSGGLSEWKNISWVQGAPYQKEIPNNRQSETEVGGANMTGNVLLWHINEGASTITDYSGNGLNGTIVGAINDNSGKFESALYFNGTNTYAYVTSNSLLNPPSELTVSVWVKPDLNYGTINNPGIVTKKSSWGGIWHGRGSAGKLWGRIYQSSGSSVDLPQRVQLPVGEWSHVTLVADASGGKVREYVNGIEVGNVSYDGTLRGSTDWFFIGYHPNNEIFNGTIDEVAFWNRTLSGQEIRDLYLRGAAMLNLSIRSCDDAVCLGESWTELDSVSSQNITLDTNNNTFFQYKFNFYSESAEFSPTLHNVTITYRSLDSIPPEIEINSPPNYLNTSSRNLSFNFTSTDNLALELNCSIYLDSSLNQTNSSVLNGTSTIFTINGILEGLHFWNISCLDASLNENQTATYNFTLDITPPNMSNIIYSPNLTSEMDPEENINFNVTVEDARMGISSVILQYNDSSTWQNLTMTQIGSTAVYNGTIALSSTEANYTFNIWTNDSLGNSNSTENQVFSSYWDCTWNYTEDLGETSGWDQNKRIGAISINNTGDIEHSNSQCSLSFHLSHDLSVGRIYFNNWDLNSVYNYYDTSPILAGTNSTVYINSTFLSEIREENVEITIVESYSRSSFHSSTMNATLLSNQNGPYLYQTITSSPLSIYLTTSTFNISSYLRNIMGSSTINENNTAYNVTFSWTLPSGIENYSGNSSNFYENITDNTVNYNNIVAEFTDLASMTPGTKEITLSSYGYNITGSPIEDAYGNTLLENTISVSFLCYNVSDGICVAACGYTQDFDCSAPSSASPSTSSGGGGGGGGIPKTESVVTSADFQLVRGEENEIKIIFENKLKNESLRDLTFSVLGDIAKYIDLSPKSLSYLGPAEKTTVTLLITSPSYINLGKQELKIILKGKKGVNSYTDSKKITLEVHEISLEKARLLLNESENFVSQINEENLSSSSINSILENMRKDIENFQLELVRKNYDSLKEQTGYALSSKKIIGEILPLIELAEKKGIDVKDSQRTISLAALSLERRDFEQAYKRAKDAQLTYALEVKGEIGSTAYYIKNYPGEISLGALFIFLFSVGTYNLRKIQKIKRRIKKLKEEEKILNELIRIVQRDCFKEKKMSMTEYESAMKEYNKRLSEIIEEVIELETRRANMLKFASEMKRLKTEKEKIIMLIKELQNDYMKKKNLETRTFELKMESFNKKISEIEEKLATLEAKKAVKKLRLSISPPKK